MLEFKFYCQQWLIDRQYLTNREAEKPTEFRTLLKSLMPTNDPH